MEGEWITFAVGLHLLQPLLAGAGQDEPASILDQLVGEMLSESAGRTRDPHHFAAK